MSTHPVQVPRGRSARVSEAVTRRAYEVYCHVYRPQPRLVEGNCRGGFGAFELIALLYAHSFPREEWAKREKEAYEGMELG